MNTVEAIDRIQTYTGEFPEKAVEWLRSHREEAIPLLLETAKNAIEAVENQDEWDREILEVLFLLSEFEVHEACSLMIKILSFDEEDIDFILGDALTENYHVMLANVMTTEDIPLLKEIIENKNYYEFARHCALSALETLAAMNKISYEQLCRYCEDFLEKMQDDEEILNFFASEADHVCTDNMSKILYNAFDNKMIDTQRISRLGFSCDELVEDKESHLRNENYFDNKRANIDTMKTWACYTENKEAGKGRKDFFSDMLKLRREIYTLRFPVNRSLDGMLSESRGMLLSLIARNGGYGNVDDMLKYEALEYLHKHIIDGVYDNLVGFGKEPYEFFMRCYGQDIVTINEVTERLLPVFQTGLVFGVRRDDKKIDCFMADDVKAEFDRIKADGGMDKIYLAKMNSDTAFKPVKIGRNDPCPCGSGKKYKKCCGR